MTMVTRQIVGYDPRTDRVEIEYDIPRDKWSDVLSLVHNNEEDPAYLYNYRLDLSVADDIMGLMGAERVTRNLDYFLECETAD